MNLDLAIAAHAAWKTKFRVAITSKAALDVATIGADHCCDLGQWLHGGAGRLYHGHPEFSTLVQKHKDFHVEAGKVATLINNQHYAEAEQAIGAGTRFMSASSETGMAINRLKKVMAPA